MLGRLGELIDDAVVGLDGATIVELVRLRDRLDVKLTELVGAFDEAQLWDADAATSMTAWLVDRAAMTYRDAFRLTITAKRLRQLPATTSAWRDCDLTGGQISVIVDRLGQKRTKQWLQHEDEIVPTLRGLSIDDTVRVLDTWKTHCDADGTEPKDEPQALFHNRVGNRWRTEGDFDALDGEIVDKAIQLATRRDAEDESSRTPSQRRAEALVDVCKYFIDNQTEKIGRRHRPHVNVVVTPDELEAAAGAHTLGGTIISGRDTAMLLCDAVLHRVVVAEGEILDYGRSIRTTPAPLWNAVAIRDQRCRFPGCDRPASWCDAHHVRWFSRGGSTSLMNLVLLCRRHHRRLHSPGWEAKLLPDGTFEVVDPEGRVRHSRPPPDASGRGQPFPLAG
jgi:hypothetical protein